MKLILQFILIFISLQLGIKASSQLKRYSVQNAHSHNDYLSPSPFYLAFNNGFGSIEADIFPVDGRLHVAHSKKEIQPEKTLKSLYIDPLVKEFAAGKKRKLRLLIDIKEDYKTSLSLLIKELEPLQSYLTTLNKSNLITIIISGTRPAPIDYKDYPDFIFFDGDRQTKHTAQEWKRVGLVSMPFTSITQWKGNDDLNPEDKKALKNIIDSVHNAGKQIRFWAAPDTKISWKWQMKLHVDLIGTDKINELAAILKGN